MKRALLRTYLILVLLTGEAVAALAQCAMCRGSVESSVASGDTSMAANLNIGIMYLFFAPYVLLGTLAFFWYRSSKRSGKKFNPLGKLAR